MGVMGIGMQTLVLSLGVLSLWGVVAGDEQWQINRAALKGQPTREMIVTALSFGDWKTAEKLYLGKQVQGVLGADAEMEKLIWPEKQVADEITFWEESVAKTPSRYAYQKLGELYGKLGEVDEVARAATKAREIDPNDATVVGY